MSFSFAPRLNARSNADRYRDGIGPTLGHEGSRKDYLVRHAAECSSIGRLSCEDRTTFVSSLLRRIGAVRNLLLALDATRQTGDKAAGPNRQKLRRLWRYRREYVYAEIHRLSREIVNLDRPDVPNAPRPVTRYQPQAARCIEFRKASGNGTRPIEVPNWQDRVVQRAIVQILQPLIDPRLAPLSFGARPHRERFEALAHAKTLADMTGCFVIITADLANAFTTVPHAPLFERVDKHVENSTLARLIREIVRAGDRSRGIAQGAPLSSLLLEIYLDTYLDRRWNQQHPHIRLIRWVDDLLILCHTVEEATQAYQELERILQPTGMRLKGKADSDITDLRTSKTATWLGCTIRKSPTNDELTYQVSEELIRDLHQSLIANMGKPDGAIRCGEALEATFQQLGPCYPTGEHQDVIQKAITAAIGCGADEPPSAEVLLRHWERSYARYSMTLTMTRILHAEPSQGSAGATDGDGVACRQPSHPGSRNGQATLASAGACHLTGSSASSVTTLLLSVAQQPSRIGCWGAFILYDTGHTRLLTGIASRPTSDERLYHAALTMALRTLPAKAVVEVHGLPPALQAEFRAALVPGPPLRSAGGPPHQPPSPFVRIVRLARRRRLSLRVVHRTVFSTPPSTLTLPIPPV